MLLLHGCPDSSHLWRHQIAALKGAGYRVIAPDQRGFGLSDRPRDAKLYRHDLLIADVISLLDDAGIDKVALISHDRGAAVGWRLAERHPERFTCHPALSVGPLPAVHACRDVGNGK